MRRLLWLVALLLWPLVAQSATYYVSNSGSDSTPCSGAGGNNAQNINFPKRTIQEAINTCWRNPGDVLDIRGGTYDEMLHSEVGTNWPSGTASQPMIMQGHAGETVEIKPSGHYIDFTLMNFSASSYLTFRNLIMDGSNLTVDTGAQFWRPDGTSHHLILEDSILRHGHVLCGGGAGDCGYFNAILFGMDDIIVRRTEIADVDGYGAYISGANNLVEDNYIHDVQGYALHLYRSGHTNVQNNIVRRNRLVHNGWGNKNPAGSCALILASGGNNVAYNNLITDSYGCGIQIYGYDNFDEKMYNNTIVGNGATTGEPCIVISGYPPAQPATGTVAQNNICYLNGQDIQNGGAGSTVSFNNPNATNPRFLDVPNGNYGLQTSSPRSAALDAAINLSSLFTGDITTPTTGLVRPATGNWDQGAYEMEAGGGSSLTPEKGTFFLAPGGTNTTDCHAATGTVGSPSTSPFGDYATARVCIQAGSTLYFRTGTYPPLDTSVTPFAGGSTTEATTFAAYPGETATLQQTTGNPVVFLRNATTDHFIIFQGLILDGDNVTGTNGFAALAGVNDIRLDGVEIKNTYYEGLFLQQTSNIGVRNGTKIHNSAFAGVGVVGLDRTTNTLITGSEVYASAGPGISSYGGNATLTIEKSTIRNTPSGKGIVLGNASNPDSGVQIANNLIYINTYGIHLQNGTSSVGLYYNTLWNNATACMLFDSGVTVSEAINNVCWQVATVTNNAGSGMTLVTNQCTGPTGCTAGDPLFASTTPGNANFLHLCGAAGVPVAGCTGASPARDTGTPLSSLTSDFAGKARPDGSGVDKGAFEEVPTLAAPVQAGMVPPFRTTFFLLPY